MTNENDDLENNISINIGIIDGMPSTYNCNYVLMNKIKCFSCKNVITEEDLLSNNIVFVEDIDFNHKDCLSQLNINYRHKKENDKNSPALLIL